MEVYIDPHYKMDAEDKAPEPNKDTMYTPAPDSTKEAMEKAGIE